MHRIVPAIGDAECLRWPPSVGRSVAEKTAVGRTPVIASDAVTPFNEDRRLARLRPNGHPHDEADGDDQLDGEKRRDQGDEAPP